MKTGSLSRRTLLLVSALALLAGSAVFVALRSGPLAPVPVTVTAVEKHAITPALFGVGTVEARYTYKLGPTAPGRIRQVAVQVGDMVKKGQLLGEMDPVDIEQRLSAQDAAFKRAAANVASAQARVTELAARSTFAVTQARRVEQLFERGSATEETVDTSRQEREVAHASLNAAQANLEAAHQDLVRVRADRAALVEQRATLQLLAPVDGVVIARNADPGTTAVAGQAIVELIDPESLWINVRFDQLGATGLRAGLPARIVLRTQTEPVEGRVLRVEPIADAVTEEILAKVVFTTLPDPLPPLGGLSEVTVILPAMPAAPSLPNASIKRIDGQAGVWALDGRSVRFAPIKAGASDLDGRVQIIEGLNDGERVVLYSQRALAARHRVQVVDRLPGIAP